MLCSAGFVRDSSCISSCIPEHVPGTPRVAPPFHSLVRSLTRPLAHDNGTVLLSAGDDGVLVNVVTDDSSDDDDVDLPYTEVKKTVITMVALPHDAADGDHTVYIDHQNPITGDIVTTALCTLNRMRRPQQKTETMFVDTPVRMRHTGGSVVSISGYETTEVMNHGAGAYHGEEESESDEYEYDYGKLLLGEGSEGESDSESESEIDSESDEEAPALVKVGGVAGRTLIPSASDDDSVEDANVSDSDLENMELGDLGGDMSSSDDDSDSDSDSELGSDDSDGEAPEGDLKPMAESDFDSDESLSMSDSDTEEDREAMRKRLKVLATPQPGKKQKVEGASAKKAPASAPASAPAAKVLPAKVPTNEAEYKAALKALIKENGGEIKVAQAGAIKRPAAVGKLGKYLAANEEFAYDKKTGSVRLA